ncbi:MAG: stage III sporulation protein AB [Oscillospiraceae bacterium]|jgi:stage III sporulation protein AB|nr:stage III sporulation protein AB [Oscillospiraceae bacterium]
MKKVFAVAIIMISSTLTGVHLSKGLLLRAAELEKARVFIVYCRTQIRYAARNVEEIIRSYIDDHRSALPLFIRQDLQLPGGVSVQERIVEALESPRIKKGLKATDIACLRAFVSSLGEGDVESQTALCDLYESLINERLADARERAEKYAGLYTALGVLAGLAVSILLI